MSWRSVVSGVLGLALLEVALSSPAASGRVGSLMTAVAGVVSHVLSPTVAAIPDLRTKGGSASTSSDTSSSHTLPAEWTTSAAAAVAV